MQEDMQDNLIQEDMQDNVKTNIKHKNIKKMVGGVLLGSAITLGGIVIGIGIGTTGTINKSISDIPDVKVISPINIPDDYYIELYKLNKLTEDLSYTYDEIIDLIVKDNAIRVKDDAYWIKMGNSIGENTTSNEDETILMLVKHDKSSKKYVGVGTKIVKNEDLEVYLINNSNMMGGDSSYTSAELTAFLLAGKARVDEKENCFYVNVGGGITKDDITYVVPQGYSLIYKYVYDATTDTYKRTDKYEIVEKDQERTRKISHK